MIGIFGGTFDPVHFGHLRPVAEVQRQLGLEHVRYIPCATPPHREPPRASAAQRVRMLQLALREFPLFRVDEREIERAGISYTVLTLESLRGELGDTPSCLLMGSDAFAGLPTWHRWTEFLELTNIAVLQRPGDGVTAAPEWARAHLVSEPGEFVASPQGKIIVCPVTPVDISSSRIRRALADAADIEGLVPEPVRHYICEQALYEHRPGDGAAGAGVSMDELKQLAVNALDDAKAQDVQVLDVRGLTDITDYMVVATGGSDRHVRSIADKVVDAMRAHGFRPLGIEGEQTGEWVLIDGGEVIVHVMQRSTRAFYDLEKLWGEDLKAMIEAQREREG